MSNRDSCSSDYLLLIGVSDSWIVHTKSSVIINVSLMNRIAPLGCSSAVISPISYELSSPIVLTLCYFVFSYESWCTK